jgi:hypothetical protein
MRDKCIKILFFIYPLTLVLCILFSIDQWPLTNFSVFRSPETIDSIYSYRWELVDHNDNSHPFKFRRAQIHDSFQGSLISLAKKNKNNIEFINNYVQSEARAYGLVKKYKSINVFKISLKKSSVDNPNCISLNKKTFCKEKEFITNVKL